MTFEALGVSTPICQAVAELGYEQPMPVQEAVIPHLLGEPQDLIALAQTGTGKTAAFGLPLLQNVARSLDESKTRTNASGHARALVLCPTRELCLQISDDLTEYSKYLPSVRILPVYGGSSIEAQIRTLRRGVEVIVATPGRLIDLMERGVASLDEVQTVVLDEADEMLNMGFTESLQTILAQVPKERHLLLFSATMPREISSIAASYMHQPREIVVGTKNQGNANIKHHYYVVSARHKYLALKRIADYYPSIYGIIFCRTRKETQEIADQLIRDGYNADALHGELSQAQRDYVMQKFRIRNLQLLVATDVAARGLDVICHSRERGRIRDIERISHATLERKHLPTGQEICQKQLFGLADRIERVEITEDATLESVLPDLLRKLDWLDKEELMRRIMLMEFRRMLDYYESEEAIEEADDKGKLPTERKEKRDKRNAVAEEGMKRLFINFGKLDKMYPNKLIELINKCVPGRVKIGKIDLMPRFSFFEVDEHEASEVVSSMSSYEVDGRRIVVDYADAVGASEGKRERRGKRTYSDDSPRASRKGKKHREDYSPRSSRKGDSHSSPFDKYKGKKKSRR